MVGNMSARLESLRSLLENEPNHTLLRYGLATELKNLGRYEEAVAEFRALIDASPDYCAAYYHCGRTLESMLRLEEARAFYEAGIEAATRTGDTHAGGELRAALELL
jgi:tetratricopeptide (TPR) repeat protein